MAAVDRASAWLYSALRWFTTCRIWATDLGRCAQLRTALIAPTSECRVAELVVSRVFTAAACRDASAETDDDGAEDAVCVGDAPGADRFDRLRATATATATITIAVPTAPNMSLERPGLCRGDPGFGRPGLRAELALAHSGLPAERAPARRSPARPAPARRRLARPARRSCPTRREGAPAPCAALRRTGRRSDNGQRGSWKAPWPAPGRRPRAGRGAARSPWAAARTAART